MKPVEDEEESVDAIAAELEKSDPEVKKAGVKSPKKGSAKKGPKKEGEKEEDWVSLIFGENGEKVTEKGKKVGEKKEGEGKDEAEELPDAEEFLMEQTQFFSKVCWRLSTVFHFLLHRARMAQLRREVDHARKIWMRKWMGSPSW